jgi:hypothetical protein
VRRSTCSPRPDHDAVLLVVDVQAVHLLVRGLLGGVELGAGLRVGRQGQVGHPPPGPWTVEIRAIAIT